MTYFRGTWGKHMNTTTIWWVRWLQSDIQEGSTHCGILLQTVWCKAAWHFITPFRMTHKLNVYLAWSSEFPDNIFKARFTIHYWTFIMQIQGPVETDYSSIENIVLAGFSLHLITIHLCLSVPLSHLTVPFLFHSPKSYC